jgi:alkylation response protein AidB-like acyl-CoA dehydrogenase
MLSEGAAEADIIRAYGKDQGRNVMREASMAKVFASEVGMKCATKAVQIHGGYGYIREFFPSSASSATSSYCEIGEGTSEVQRTADLTERRERGARAWNQCASSSERAMTRGSRRRGGPWLG